MAYRKNILLGRILKVSGYKGAVSVKLEKSFTENIPEMESVFLEIEGRPVPFFISGYEYGGGDILKLTFEDYESAGKIAEFAGCDIYLTGETPIAGDAEDPEDLEGFKILDSGGKIIGTVVKVLYNSGQWLLYVLSPANKEILVPFHEDLIVKADKNNMHLILDLPEGLTEIN